MNEQPDPFAYTVVRSQRRTLALEIRADLTLLVRAPRRCPKGEIERLLRDKAAWINAHLEAQRRRNEARPEPDAAERQRLISLAKAELPQRVRRYAARMGLQPAGIRITGAAKRFGSCSSQNRLCFSWRLLQYPEAAVDYVVVHELAHLVYRNHGRDFYVLIASVLPDYRERQQLLRE